ncbi:unnamed protein product [Withania somnifera]
MGANASSIETKSDDGLNYLPLNSKLDDIPEACVALVLSYLDPPEICKLARIDRVFRAASSADFIWEPKLPSNYKYIFQKLLGLKVDGIGKKTFLLSFLVLVPLMVAQRFRTVAYLQQIWWLEVDGDLEFQFPEGTYSLFFRLHLGKVTRRQRRRACNYEHVHGWDLKPVHFQLTTEGGCRVTSRCYLDNVGTWMQHHVGDFVVKDATVPTKIRFALTQIDCTHTKGGLCVDSVLICPCSLAKEFSC